jgi:hypothetical protein
MIVPTGRGTMIGIGSREVALPAKAVPGGWGYGTAVAALPGTRSVVLALPSAGSRSPWCVVDLDFGHVTKGTSMPGSLRDLVAAQAESGDRRPWALGMFGLGRLDLGDRPTVSDVVRKGIGTYPSTLVDYAPGVLAVGHPHRDSVVLVSTADGSVLKRLRASGSPAYRLEEGVLRMVSFHHGRAYDVDTTRHRVVRRQEVPSGKGARLVGDAVFALVGERRPLQVFTATGAEDVSFPGGWAVSATELVALDAMTLAVRHRATAPDDAVEVLGGDAAGRLVVSRHDGLSILAPPTYAEVGRFDAGRRIAGAGMVPGANLAAVVPNDSREPALLALRW